MHFIEKRYHYVIGILYVNWNMFLFYHCTEFIMSFVSGECFFHCTDNDNIIDLRNIWWVENLLHNIWHHIISVVQKLFTRRNCFSGLPSDGIYFLDDWRWESEEYMSLNELWIFFYYQKPCIRIMVCLNSSMAHVNTDVLVLIIKWDLLPIRDS